MALQQLKATQPTNTTTDDGSLFGNVMDDMVIEKPKETLYDTLIQTAKDRNEILHTSNSNTPVDFSSIINIEHWLQNNELDEDAKSLILSDLRLKNLCVMSILENTDKLPATMIHFILLICHRLIEERGMEKWIEFKNVIQTEDSIQYKFLTELRRRLKGKTVNDQPVVAEGDVCDLIEFFKKFDFPTKYATADTCEFLPSRIGITFTINTTNKTKSIVYTFRKPIIVELVERIIKNNSTVAIADKDTVDLLEYINRHLNSSELEVQYIKLTQYKKKSIYNFDEKRISSPNMDTNSSYYGILQSVHIYIENDKCTAKGYLQQFKADLICMFGFKKN